MGLDFTNSTRNPFTVIKCFENRCKQIVNKMKKDTDDGDRLQTRLDAFRCFTRRLNDISGCPTKISTLADMILTINQDEYRRFVEYANQKKD